MEGALLKTKELDNCHQPEIPNDINSYPLSSYWDAKQDIPLERPANLGKNNKENPSKRKLDSSDSEEEKHVFKKFKHTSDETHELHSKLKVADKNLSDARKDGIGQNSKDDPSENESESLTQNVDISLSETPPELDETKTSGHEQDSQAEDNSLSTKEDERSSSSEDDEIETAPATIYKRPEAERFPKLYRLLRDGETINHGLSAKNPSSNLSIAEHVARGSNGSSSRYISTCSSISSAQELRRLKSRGRFRYGTKQIVEIDVDELPRTSVRIIDLTTRELRMKFELPGQDDINRKFHKHAAEFNEVLLEGTVPASCVKEYS